MAVRASIGTFYFADSPIHRMDPRVKFISTVAFMASCLFIDTPAALGLAALVISFAILRSRVPVRVVISQVKPIALFLVATSFINLFFVRTGNVVLALGPLCIYEGGVFAAALYTLRFLLLVLAGSLLTLTTTPTALTDGISRLFAPLERVGLPVSQIALILSIALRFAPVLAQEADNVMAAQTARGADLENKGALAYARACVPLVVPLFASSIRHAENLARAMEARCYTGTDRTQYHELRLDVRLDGACLLVLFLYLAAMAALHL